MISVIYQSKVKTSRITDAANNLTWEDMTKSKYCYWELDPSEEFYEMGCGGAYCFTEGDLEENKFVFCPKCGKKIKEKT